MFENKIKDAPYVAIVLNSAFALYIAKKANSLVDAIELSKNIIKNNLALEKFEQIKKIYL